MIIIKTLILALLLSTPWSVTAYTWTGNTTAWCKAGECKWPEKGIVACPKWLDLGTVVRIGERTLTCGDRTDLKTDFDIFYGRGKEAEEAAWEWGRRRMRVQIVEYAE